MTRTARVVRGIVRIMVWGTAFLSLIIIPQIISLTAGAPITY